MLREAVVSGMGWSAREFEGLNGMESLARVYVSTPVNELVFLWPSQQCQLHIGSTGLCLPTPW